MAHDATVHTPAVQLGVPSATAHTLPHAPQLLTSVCVCKHAVPQHVSPAAHPCVELHPGTHAPAVQTLPAAQLPSPTQPTHTCRVGSQYITPASPAQSASAPHPVVHTLPPAQYCPGVHARRSVGVHCTHVPVTTLHACRPSSLDTQSESDVQPAGVVSIATTVSVSDTPSVGAPVSVGDVVSNGGVVSVGGFTSTITPASTDPMSVAGPLSTMGRPPVHPTATAPQNANTIPYKLGRRAIAATPLERRTPTDRTGVPRRSQSLAQGSAPRGRVPRACNASGTLALYVQRLGDACHVRATPQGRLPRTCSAPGTPATCVQRLGDACPVRAAPRGRAEPAKCACHG